MLATLLAAGAALLAQDAETISEVLADGARVTCEVVRTADGAAVRHGEYTELWPDETRRASGRYKNGLRHGRWRSWHENGESASSGSYKEGLRDRKWTVRLADGTLVEAESGEFAPLELEYESGAVRSRGETKDGARHGRWTFYWENGVELAGGTYADGALSGPWWFRHLDGTFDADWISGVYAEGRRAGPFPPGRAAEEQARTLAIGEPARGTAAWKVERLLDRMRGDDERQRERSFEELWEEVLDDLFLSELLARLDLEGEAEGPLAADLLRARIHPLFEGTRPWWPPAEDAGPEARRLDTLRWASLLQLAGAHYRALGLPFDSGEARRALMLSGEEPVALQPMIHPPLSDGSRVEADTRVARSPYRTRFEPRDEDKDERAALDRALDWLARHQMENGSWDADGFYERCKGETVCGDLGADHHDAGVTALALLALLGDGNTSDTGPHREAVGRGLRWLIEQQDPDTGIIGELVGMGWIYSQGAAVTALSEALVFSGDRHLRAAVELGLRPILRARNPYGAWRYDPIPQGDNDTSVTGWMLVALWSAQRAGIDVDPAPFEGGMSWIDEVTDPATGRCGYDKLGSMSSRVEGVNEQFPPDKGEAMSAVALLTRVLMGQPPSEEVLKKHGALLMRTQPEWDPDGLGCDMYYWYYGSNAIAQMPQAEFARPWRKALRKALLGSQVEAGCGEGSWDPVGPWGWAGGRTYATALMALCLEAPWRYVVLFPEKKRR